jgi:hypothetical protein
MLVLTILAFTAVFALGLFTLGETLASNRGKILSALAGKSPLAQAPLSTRPVTVRMVSRPVSRPVAARSRLRVAA